MMKPFKGHSGQTHCMKKKLIKEGHKFFSMCDVETGHVFKILPNGHLKNCTICDTVLSLVGILPSVASGHCNDCVVAMDNCFTWSKVVDRKWTLSCWNNKM